MDALIIEQNSRFNYLRVLSEVSQKRVLGKRPKRQFLCECICGRRLITRLDSLRNNKKSSCGCQPTIKTTLTGNPVQKHGLSYEPLYKIWKHIRRRCYSVGNPNYFRYGGRGIRMCNEWYLDVVPFFDWSVSNGYKEGLELDRINNDLGYSPDNCRWTTSEVNNNNKRNNKKYNYNGEWLTLPQISRRDGTIGFPTLYRRINENKLTIDEALSIPLHGKCKKNRVSKCKLRASSIVAINNSNLSWRKLAKKYNTSQTTVWRIKTGKYLYGKLLNNGACV